MPIQKDNDLNINPGEQLQLLLMELHPFDQGKKSSFVSTIDLALRAEGDLEKLVYESMINYMLRRLITSAEYLRRFYEHRPDREFIVHLRKFLKDETEIPQKHLEKVFILLIKCLEERKKNPTSKRLRRIRRLAEEKGDLCYICGVNLEFKEPVLPVTEEKQISQFNSAEIDHIWPNAMGGVNEDENLKVSCMRCNKVKLDYINASDFHYEEICLVSQKSDPHFSNELPHDYRVALWAKSEFRCIRCSRPATYVGQLQFARRNPNDSWHFLNIDAYCDQHSPE